MCHQTTHTLRVFDSAFTVHGACADGLIRRLAAAVSPLGPRTLAILSGRDKAYADLFQRPLRIHIFKDRWRDEPNSQGLSRDSALLAVLMNSSVYTDRQVWLNANDGELELTAAHEFLHATQEIVLGDKDQHAKTDLNMALCGAWIVRLARTGLRPSDCLRYADLSTQRSLDLRFADLAPRRYLGLGVPKDERFMMMYICSVRKEFVSVPAAAPTELRWLLRLQEGNRGLDLGNDGDFFSVLEANGRLAERIAGEFLTESWTYYLIRPATLLKRDPELFAAIAEVDTLMRRPDGATWSDLLDCVEVLNR